MNNNPLLGQVLGGLFGQALGRRATGGGLPGGLGGGMGGALGGIALGSVLAAAMRGRGQPVPVPGGGNRHANRSALLVMLLPPAMRWVQRNGGMGAVLARFRQKGMGQQAQSWMSSGTNEPINEQSVEQVVGADELRQMAQRLGVPEQDVASAFAEIMPQMVDHLTPQGDLPQHADEVLDESTRALEKEIQDVQYRELPRS